MCCATPEPVSRVFQCYTTHTSHVRTCGRPQRPCIATREQPAFVMSSRRVSSQGWEQGHGFSPRGSTNRVPGLLDTLLCQKKAASRGSDAQKSWSSHFCWDRCMRACPGPILDLRVGAGRTGWRPKVGVLAECVCVRAVDGRSMSVYHMADCCRLHLRESHDSHAARTGLRLPAGSRSRTSHVNLVKMRLMERPGFMDQTHDPRRNEKFPSVRWSAIYRDAMLGCASPPWKGIPRR